MASFLLGDEYASSSSSDEESSPVKTPNSKPVAPVSTTSHAQKLPSADELFASDTSGVLTASHSTATAVTTIGKRKSEQVSRPATKAVKSADGDTVRKPKIAPFAPPQLRRPNISTEDRSSWNTDRTMALQRKAQAETTSQK
ncbi:hypothetical protein PHYBOEH_000471 [Phytophthora boehmeriae]|uniref:Uncharacterized protein n=1 Tax=Phytophthora boehmeriae TaxID=109152 RepID=A0A8T1WVH0_9STRA|nr:hypothetical protein PHYBOEH_000471 [Phytophthora boehmeriae]